MGAFFAYICLNLNQAFGVASPIAAPRRNQQRLIFQKCLIHKLGQGNIESPNEETATPEELKEAAFCVLKEAHAGTRPPGVYHERYITWLLRGLPSWEAYLERAGIYLKAHCYLQVPRATRPPPVPLPPSASPRLSRSRSFKDVLCLCKMQSQRTVPAHACM